MISASGFLDGSSTTDEQGLPVIMDTGYDAPEDELQSEFLFLFRFLKERENLFTENYPFRVDLKNNKLSLLPASLSDKHNLYIALLLSSILAVYDPGVRNKLGHLFEELAHIPFQKLIAIDSRIEFFGSGSHGKGKSLFHGSFADKVKTLAGVLKTDTTTLFKQNIHDHQHSGDGGLDWVAWYPFKDNMSKMPVFFGQCACGNDWIDKEWDAHEDKWRNHIQLNDSFLLFHFIGKSFRKQDGNWYKPGIINRLILVDRLRLLSLLSSEDSRKAIPIYQDLIDEALSLRV